jgi:hypothetical protein
LALPPIEKAHEPSSRLTAIVLIRVVCARAAASSGEIPVAISLATNLGFLIRVGHGPRGYQICSRIDIPLTGDMRELLGLY